MGEEEGDTVETCSGGLLGKEIFKEKVFLYKIPIIGISGCEFAGFLQVIVNAVDKIVNQNVTTIQKMALAVTKHSR